MYRGSLLVADDDKRFVLNLSRVLLGAGYEVTSSYDGRAASEYLTTPNRWDAAVLDVTMPRMSGLEVLQQLRSGGCDLPVLLLTGLDSEVDVVLGFDVGADDYLAKPFRSRELVARLGRLIRSRRSEVSPIAVGDAVFTLATHEIAGPRGTEPLTASEVRLVEPLLSPPGRVVQKTELLAAVWGSSSERNTRSLYEHIRRLRARLGEVGTRVDIKSVRHQGYRLVEN